MNFQAALTYGLPGARVAKALADWQGNELPGEYYQMLNASGEDIGLLLKAFGLEVPAKIYIKRPEDGVEAGTPPGSPVLSAPLPAAGPGEDVRSTVLASRSSPPRFAHPGRETETMKH